MKTTLSRVSVLHDGQDGEPAVVHASLVSGIDEGDLNHSVSAVVVLRYTHEELKRLTLDAIHNDALARLPQQMQLDK